MTVATPEVVLAGARVVRSDGVRTDQWVHVADGRIAAVGGGARPDGVRVQDLQGAWLLPGYIDLHMHGGGGHDASTSLAGMRSAVAFHRSHGTTRTLVSLVTAPVADLVQQLRWVSELVAGGGTPEGHVVGGHVEGPFLSAVRCGAQNTRHMLAPDPAVLAQLVEAAQGSLRCMTVAPELPGGLDLVRELVRSGVIAALGHSDATYAQARAAMDAGASLVTHIFNGMRPLHHREPGLVGAALESGIACELINDGIHTHPAVLRLVERPVNRMVLVTDAIDAAGVGDGTYSLGGQEVNVHDGRAQLATTSDLAGSTLTMDEAVRRAVLVTGLPIEAASAAASGNPARVLGLADRVGTIAAGLDADLVVLDEDLRTTAVMAGGIWSAPTSRYENGVPLV
jgi:N-acetylglucosamine-6-phosphate deacetylase